MPSTPHHSARSTDRPPNRTGRTRAVGSVVSVLAAATALVASASVMSSGRAQAVTPPAPVVDWTTTQPVASPPALSGAASAYDGSTSTVVLFGGVNSSGTVSGDTWVWNGQSWTDYPAGGGGPAARQGASMAFDPTLNELILFGGQAQDGTLLNDTWAWNGASWTQAPTSAVPPARETAGFAYDPGGNLVLFGGTGVSASAGPNETTTTVAQSNQTAAGSPTVLSDTWLWTASGWTASSASGPAARSGAAMVYDTAAQSTVLFGGSPSPAGTAPAQLLDDTWTWNGSAWAQASPASSPAGRAGAGFTDDPAASGALLTDGSGAQGALADAWIWNGSSWAEAQVSGSAPARTAEAAAYDAADSEAMVFGGADGTGAPLGDTDLLTSVATESSPTPPPVASTTTTTQVASRPTTSVATGGTRPPSSPTTAAKPAKAHTVAPTTAAAPPKHAALSAPLGPTPTPSLQLQTSIHNVRRGTPVHLSGSGFRPGSVITITFHSTPAYLGSTVANQDGDFSMVVDVPQSASPGEHHIIASGTTPSGERRAQLAAVFVLNPPRVGTSTATKVVLVALALLLPAGAWLVMAGAGWWRRRRGAIRAPQATA